MYNGYAMNKEHCTAGGTRHTVSVLIPMYQGEKYILEALRSVLAQSVPAEIIVVDDGSQDAGAERVREFIAAVPEADIVLLERAHCGQAAARNAALEAASGEYIFYLDADDVLTEGALEALCTALDEHPEAGAVCSMCRDFISPELSPEEAARLKIQEEPYRRMLSGCTMIRKEVYDLVGCFDESLPSSETAQWMLRMQDAGVKIYNIDTVTLLRRYHLTNFGRVSRQTQLKSYMEIIRQRRKADGKQK